MKTQTPKCYSYCRFSSKIQAKGHSLQRQIERSKKWATDRGLVLDESTFADLGVSGYSKTSNNVSNGALGKFLEQVKEGKIPPKSILIVESLDTTKYSSLRLFIKGTVLVHNSSEARSSICVSVNAG